VTKVLAVKVPRTPETLPHTGNSLPLVTSVGGALALVTLGLLMVAVSRRNRPYTPSD
jgi:LPXTG-motif cell wall-anchored protein